MKHFMQPRNAILRENHPIDTPPPPPAAKQQRSGRKQKLSKENAPPADLNTMPDLSTSPAVGGKQSSGKLKSPLPPRPPNPLKRKLVDNVVDDGGVGGSCDSGVKVIVRMRPPNKDEEEGEMIVQKTSGDSVSIAGQTFTFDSVADFESTQMDIFQLVGAPLVENCLAGFNSSVFAYGQTGSGKTYTIWGPGNALLEENLSSDQQGLTPRVFERLFSRIDEEQNKHTDKQLRYQCRCSFLEIYNEQITDLLDPNQRNLQIREDVKTGVYVENLREECVCTMKDVTRLLMKGLSNRRTGATSINSESSRSHSVFTCVVESRCKSAADGLSCFKSSRINLVDLAGSERQKLTGAAGERLKEAGNINRSLSQLGNLINILAEVSQTGKQRHIPYRDSKLTFLLQESLGGNAKLAMVCAISPAQSCKSETFSTLRFAQRAKAIKNKAVVNEEVQDDVNVLKEVIRQLKDELFRMKEKGKQSEPSGGYSTGWNARRSLNLLKFSLNRPISLPNVDDDGDEEMEIVDQAEQIGLLLADIEENNSMDGKKLEGVLLLDPKLMTSAEGHQNASKRISCEKQVNLPFTRSVDNITGRQGSEDTDVNMEEENLEQVEMHAIIPCYDEERGISSPSYLNTEVQNCIEGESEENLTNSVGSFEKKDSGKPNPECVTPSINNFPNEENSKIYVIDTPTSHVSVDYAREPCPPNSSSDIVDPSNLCIVACEVSPVLKSPTPSVSPTVCNSSRKSLRTSSTLTASQKDLRDDSNLAPETIHLSFAKPTKSGFLNTRSTQTKKHYNQSSEHLAASLQRGLDVLDSHRQSSGLRRSSFRFSYKPRDIKSSLQVHKVDVGVQTLLQDDELAGGGVPTTFLCSKCNNRNSQELIDANDNSNMQLVTVDNGSQSAEKSVKQVPKAVEKVLAGAIRREMALEEYCTKQNLEIRQLNRLVQQYKHERECNTIIGQMREDKIVRLESLMDGILSTEDFMEDELVSLKDENKILKDKYDNHPELLSTKIELKRVQDELERYRNFHDMGEREVLVEEIQDLRDQLQYYTDATAKSAKRRSPLPQLTYSCEPSAAPSLCSIPESTGESAEQKLEAERALWIEAESNWISLAEELRGELEATRVLAEKQREELDLEKKCSEELKVSMQMAMQGHARMIEQYADLQEKHVQLLDRHRKIQDGIEDVKKAAAKAGVRGAESKFINALAAEISALKVEREKERRYLRDENKGLQAQLRDTSEALQAASELLVRLKEAEEAVDTAQNQAAEAVQETERAYKQINELKRKHEQEVSKLNQLLEETLMAKEVGPVYDTVKEAKPIYEDSNMAKYDAVELDTADQRWREEFDPFYSAEEESSKLVEPSSWFSGYDRCNI